MLQENDEIPKSTISTNNTVLPKSSRNNVSELSGTLTIKEETESQTTKQGQKTISKEPEIKLEANQEDQTLKTELNLNSENKENISQPHPIADIKLKIVKKRQIADNLQQDLACEEARYTLCKKIRISQLSCESKNMNTRQDINSNGCNANVPAATVDSNGGLVNGQHHTHNGPNGHDGHNQHNGNAIHNSTPPINGQLAAPVNGRQSASKSSGTTTPNAGFKHIDPDYSVKVAQTKVVTPTPKLGRGQGRPAKSTTIARDLKDTHQLASYLAQNAQLTEQERAIAKNIVWRKNRNNILADVSPPSQDYSEIIFLPSMERLGGGNEFVNLIGLEQVVNGIKIQNVKKKGDTEKTIHGHLDNAEDWKVKEEGDPGVPFECAICTIDFSPQWYKNKDSEDSGSVFCVNCYKKDRQKSQMIAYNQTLKATFKQAMEIEKEMEIELKLEYDRQVEQIEEQKAKKLEAANNKIMMLKKEQERKKKLEEQKQKLMAEAASKARDAKLASEQIKILMDNSTVNNSKQAPTSSKSSRTSRYSFLTNVQGSSSINWSGFNQNGLLNGHNGHPSSSSTIANGGNSQAAAVAAATFNTNGQSPHANANHIRTQAQQPAPAQSVTNGLTEAQLREVLPKLIQQISQQGILEKASTLEKQKIFEVIQHCMNSAGLQPDEMLAITKILQEVQEQQKRKVAEEERLRIQRQAEAERKRKEEERQRILEEQERRKRAEAELKKKAEMENTMNVIINLMTQPGIGQADQQQLMQLLLAHTNSQPDAQQKLIEHITKFVNERTRQTSSRR